MKVLFVASGNKAVGKCSAFVQSQYDSLEAAGLEMCMFPIVGKGVKGHLKAIRDLRKMVKRERPDIIHAHYSICGYVAKLATIGLYTKIVVSILGSFPTRDRKWKMVRYCIQHWWNATLVKSERTRAQLGLDLPIIPNGVNIERFRPLDHKEARKAVGFEDDKKYVVWCSNPARPEKNWTLAESAVKRIEVTGYRLQVELVAVYNKTPEEVVLYMNAADCLLLTSWSEGSPNVIKEAMACNCPIVTTDVGDVTERLKNLEGCHVLQVAHPVISSESQRLYGEESAQQLAILLRKALDFGQRTKGAERIMEDGLTVELTAKKIIKLYESIMV